MAKVEQKQVVINEIKERFKDAKSAVLVNARGLTVEQDSQLRKKLREAGVFYKVYKNTMMNLAVEGTPFEGLKDYFSGPNTLALSYSDATAAARVLSKEIKNIPTLEFNAGVIDNAVYDAKGMARIAEIPPREELLAKLLGSFKSPLASFARVINAIAEKSASPASAAETVPAAE